MTLDDMRFGTLDGIPGESLYEAFLDAFSDYAVPITATLEDFMAMHARRGVSYGVSVGAFDGERLAGFIFNGVGTWLGTRCAYDAGTGVLPSYRGLGLSKALAGESAGLLARSGISGWLLEVLVGNEKAIGTYKGAGFAVTRRFRCVEGAVADPLEAYAAASGRAGVRIAPMSPVDTRSFAPWRNWEPSWQNSDDSVERSPESLLALCAFSAKEGVERPVGYLVATNRGSVFQACVRPDCRRSGIGSALVAALAAKTPGGAVRYVNVQSDDVATLGLLASFGIEGGRDQWEMFREIR